MPISPVHQDDGRVVELFDQGHVAEDPRVALMVDGAAVGELDDEAHRPAARLAAVHGRTLTVWISDFGVSRIVVLSAFEQLAAEGYIEATPGAGTRVRRERLSRARAAHAAPQRRGDQRLACVLLSSVRA
jgi:Bacterial regulatory proteins, gntR family